MQIIEANEQQIEENEEQIESLLAKVYALSDLLGYDKEW